MIRILSASKVKPTNISKTKADDVITDSMGTKQWERIFGGKEMDYGRYKVESFKVVLINVRLCWSIMFVINVVLF